MKNFCFILLMAFTAIGAVAQSTQATQTVRGAVIDKNGNPLPGAEVFATGGAETTVTDADGTFTLEVPVWLKSLTARYAGMSDKKLKTDFNSNMIFTMSPAIMKSWFINLEGGIDASQDGTYGRVGLMGGRLGNWGYYGKLMLPATSDVEDFGVGIHFTIGAIKHVYKSIYAYLGAGYGGCFDYENVYSYYDCWWEAGGAFEGGFIVRIGQHFNCNLGYLISSNFDYATDHNINLGIGYVF